MTVRIRPRSPTWRQRRNQHRGRPRAPRYPASPGAGRLPRGGCRGQDPSHTSALPEGAAVDERCANLRAGGSDVGCRSRRRLVKGRCEPALHFVPLRFSLGLRPPLDQPRTGHGEARAGSSIKVLDPPSHPVTPGSATASHRRWTGSAYPGAAECWERGARRRRDASERQVLPAELKAAELRRGINRHRPQPATRTGVLHPAYVIPGCPGPRRR